MVNVQNDEFKKVSDLANKNMNQINTTLKEKTDMIDKDYDKTNIKIVVTPKYLKLGILAHKLRITYVQLYIL